MSLFKSGRDKADDLLVILIPALKYEIETQIRRRLLEEMEDIVQDAAQQVVRYSFSDVINQLSIDVRVPKKEWVGLTDIEIHILKMQYDKVKVAYTDTAKNLSVLGQDVNVDGLISAIESKLKEKNNAT